MGEIRDLGPGLATALGKTSGGVNVRATDAACVTGISYYGRVAASGAVTPYPLRSAPDAAPFANVFDFGLDPTGATACDAAFAAMCARLAATKVTSFYFPAGKYLFAASIDYLPRAVTLRGDGLSDQAGARFYTGSGTRLLFSGAGDGIIIGNGTNTSSGGCIRDLEILGIRNTDIDGQSTFQGTAPTGAVDPTNINDRGIHLYGAVGFTIQNIRMGGFKRQISVDGGESIYGRHIEFSGGGDGYGYQSMLDPSDKPASVTADDTTKTFTRSAGSWIAQAFKVGQTVVVGQDPHFTTGGFSGINLGAKTITAVTDLVLTVSEALADETATHSWFKVNHQDNSARAIEIGSFDFVVPVSANIVSFDDCLFNNTQVGIFHQSGTCHVVSRSSYEIPTWAWIQGAVNVLYHSSSGEGAQSAALLLRHMSAEGATATINLTIDNCLSDPHYPILASDTTYPCGAVCPVIRGCDFDSMGIYGRYPVEGDSIAGLVDGGGNRLPASGVSEGALCENYTVSQSSAVVGTTINHGKKARAAVHTNLYSYDVPLDLLSSEDYDYYSRSPPATATGKQSQTKRQVYSVATNTPGAIEVTSIGHLALAGGAAASATGDALIPIDGAGRATLDVTGYRVDDMSKSGTWRIHQRFYRTGGALNLIGAATTEYADVDGAWGFTAPTLAVSGYNLRAAITSHATIATVWAVTVVAIEAAP